MKLIPTLCAATLFGIASAPAWAQVESREGIALQNQIMELRQEMQQLGANGSSQQQAPPPYQQPYSGGGGSGGSGPSSGAGGDTAAELVVRVSAMEEQMRQLQGRVDDLTNQVQRQNDQLSKQIGDLAFKLGQGGGSPGIGGGGNGGGGGVEVVPAAPPDGAFSQGPGSAGGQRGGPSASSGSPQSGRPASGKRPAEMALREGNAALARRDYASAAAAAQEVLAAGKGPRSTDAQFLLARAENGQHQYRQAAADFYDAYNRAPRSGQAPVALLGVANALIALNDSKDACQALAKLGVEFPSPGGGIKAGVNSAKKRAACH